MIFESSEWHEENKRRWYYYIRRDEVEELQVEIGLNWKKLKHMWN